MKFHVFDVLPRNAGESPETAPAECLTRLSEAEAQGFDGIWLADCQASDGGIGPAVHLAAAWLSARTATIRIASVASLQPSFHPLRLAEEIAMLDILSGGRFGWAAGPARPEPEGGDPAAADASDEPLRIFREQLEIAELAWRGEPFHYDGRRFQIPELRCLPTPVQQPRPPIWIADLEPGVLAWAGRQGHPIFVGAFAATAHIEESLAVHRAAASGDRAAPGLAVLRRIHVGESQARAREEAAAALRSFQPARRARAAEDRDDADTAIVGDAAHCRERIAALQERTGLDHLVCWQGFGGLPVEARLASQRRLIEKVAPAFA